VRTVLVVSDNLFLRPRLESVLSRAGWSARWVRDAEGVPASLEGIDALLVDLTARGADWRTVVARVAGRPDAPPVVGFGPHVERELFAEAKRAGCARVVPNGRVAAAAGAILDEIVGGP